MDLFPPSPRDPQGIHKAIWDEVCEAPFELPTDKPLTVAAYSAGEPKTAYVEPVAVGDPLPEMPIFLDPFTYVPAPLETTYQSTWSKCPDAVKELVEAQVLISTTLAPARFSSSRRPLSRVRLPTELESPHPADLHSTSQPIFHCIA